MSIEKKPSKLMQNLLLFPIRTFIEQRSKVVIERNDTLQMNGPYIILGNHVTNWDPLLINSYVDEPICFIAGDSLFRNPLLKRILDYTGAIPKMKYTNDIRTIRSILKAKKHNRAIGIFPEGNRNWDGTTETFTYATAKLVKSLNIPVVVATIRGGHLSQPRWADHHRKGTISISMVKKWDKDELTNETPEKVHQKLWESLYYDEMEWQKEKQLPYTGKKLAHYLERFLFICPHCHKPGNLYSDNDLFLCRNCDYTVRYNMFGMFEQISEHQLHFSTPRDWNKWQLAHLEKTALDPEWQLDWKKAMNDHVKLFVSEGNEKFKHVSSGTLLLGTPDAKIIFEKDDGNTFVFSFHDLDGLNIHLHHKLDFYHEGKLYRFQFYQPRTSAYKWLKMIKTIQALNDETTKEALE